MKLMPALKQRRLRRSYIPGAYSTIWTGTSNLSEAELIINSSIDASHASMDHRRHVESHL